MRALLVFQDSARDKFRLWIAAGSLTLQTLVEGHCPRGEKGAWAWCPVSDRMSFVRLMSTASLSEALSPKVVLHLIPPPPLPLFFCFYFVLMGIFPWEMWVAFPEESQL